MRPAFVLLACGAVLAPAVYFATREREASETSLAEAPDRPRASGLEPSAADPQELNVELLRLLTGSFGPTERAGVAELAARADETALDQLARTAAALPGLKGRAFALETLLTRYAEVEPRSAVALARELAAPTPLLAALHRDWARSDPAAVLRELSAYDGARATAIALELLTVLDENAIERLLAAAPLIDETRLRTGAAVAKAGNDLEGAIDDALRLPLAQRRDALAGIGAAAAKQDVHRALELAEFVSEDLRGGDAGRDLRSAVLREWASFDAEAMLDYVLDLGPEEQETALAASGLVAFSQLDPARALELAEQLPGDAAQDVRRSALMGVANEDPLEALRRVDAMPPGPERTQALGVAARAYVAADPEAALAWAQSLQPPDPKVLASVLAGFARVDPDRALDRLFTTVSPADQLPMFQSLVIGGSLSASSTAAIADRLAASPAQRGALQTITRLWAERQPEQALEWLITSGETQPAGYARAAESLARKDPAAAAAYLSRIPNELRGVWIASAAAGQAQTDATAAASWVARYEGQPGYEAAVANVARRAARTDPHAAAQLLGTIDLGAATESVAAATAIATRWAGQDAPAARDWVMSLPTGDARDAALAPVVGAIVADRGFVEPSVLAAFSTESAEQRGLFHAAIAVAQRDAAAARQLANQYLTDPALRRNLEQLIDR